MLSGCYCRSIGIFKGRWKCGDCDHRKMEDIYEHYRDDLSFARAYALEIAKINAIARKSRGRFWKRWTR